MRCSSYCITGAFDLEELTQFLFEKGANPRVYEDVVYIKLPEKDRETDEGRERDGDVFIFRYGCVTTWGVLEEAKQEIFTFLKPFQKKALQALFQDHYTYIYGEKTHIDEEEDLIELESDDPLIKLSLSYGFSQSVKLEAFEESIAETIEINRHIPQALAEKGKISLSHRKLSRKMGMLFAAKHSITLRSDILDTPEFFWRRPKYEPYYHMASTFLDIQTRLDILNRRLAVIHELYEILSNELKHAQTARLEMVIVFLIMIEVILVLLKDILHWI